MTQFRWATKALVGAWHGTRIQALMDAVDNGQASVNRGRGSVVTLSAFAVIEQRAA